MKIAVLGASGRSGKAFVAMALARGHSVRAGVRGSSPFAHHPHLKVVGCDALRPEDVQKLVHGQDAVVSLIGHVHGSKHDVQSVATRHVIDAMHAQGVKRLVSLTGTGVRRPGDVEPWYDKLLNTAVLVLDKHRVLDGREHARLIENSGLDWTIVRVLKLQELPTPEITLLPHGPTALYVSRRAVAEAIVDVLERGSSIGNMPIISLKRHSKRAL